MPLLVVPFCAYYTKTEPQWRDEEFRARNFVKSVKGEAYNGHAYVPINGQRRRLSQQNADDALDWFATWAASIIEARIDDGGALAIVPIPNSGTVVGGPRGRTTRLASKIVGALGSRARAHQCGERRVRPGSADARCTMHRRRTARR